MPLGQGPLLISGPIYVTGLYIRISLFNTYKINNEKIFKREREESTDPFCFIFKIFKTYFIYLSLNSYLRAFITQRTVEKGKNDMENLLVVVELVAVFITQPFPKKSENPVTFYFVLQVIKNSTIRHFRTIAAQ